MTERLRQIELLYHAALEHDESARATFLDSACAGDEGLRREVDSLLSYSKCSEDFIETPAFAIMAKELAARIDERTEPPKRAGRNHDAAIRRLVDEVDRRLDSRPRKREARGNGQCARRQRGTRGRETGRDSSK
jgi:hypothetical protein